VARAEIEDILLGCILGALTFPIIGLWSLVSVVACAYFWWKGGRKGNSWQVYGCTVSCYLPMFLVSQNWMVLIPAIPTGVLLSMGYGIPSTQPPDKGSTLGRFFYKYFDEDEKKANFFTRGTIYAGLVICFIVAYVLWRVG
jgi:hypothetical protein